MTTNDDKKVEVFETEEDLEQALLNEQAELESGGSSDLTKVGEQSIQKLSDLTQMSDEQRASAQAALYTIVTGGFVKGVSKAFNGNKPLGTKLMIGTGIVAAIGAGGIVGALFGKKK